MPIYNQRWLREHQAVPTELGWKRHNTNEMLKMEKGLDTGGDVPQPIFRGAKILNVPKTVKVDPITFKTTFTFDYEIDEVDYEPISIVPVVRDNALPCTFVVDRVNKKIECNFSDVNVDGKNIWMHLYVEGNMATPIINSVYFSIDYQNPTVNRVILYGGAYRIYYNEITKKGRASYGFRVYDTVIEYEKEDVEVIIEYDGNGIVTSSVPIWSSVGNLIYIDISGDIKEGEEIGVTASVKGVKSAQSKIVVTFDKNNASKIFDEMTIDEKYQFHQKIN